MDQTSIKSRAALGQIASLGDLYDARTDTFCGILAFKKSIDPETIELLDNHFSEIRLIHKDTFSEKASTLNIEGELQVSILADLFKLSGSGRYMKDEKTSSRSVKISLLYNITTKYEKVNICHEKLKDAFALEAIESAKATHIVVGITWGANTLLTCENLNTDNKGTSEIKASLSPTLEKIAEAIKGEGNINFNFKKDDVDNSVNNSFDIRIYGDILPQGLELPTTAEDAVNLMKQMPNLVSTCNQGRGNPLIFHMIPISLLKDSWKFSFKVDHLIKTLEEESILRVVQLFDQLAFMRQRINDFHHDATKHKFCVPSESIGKLSKLKKEYAIYEATLRSKLASILTAVRSGTVDMVELENFIRDFKSGQYSPEKLEASLCTWKDIPEKISFAKLLIQNGAKYIGFDSSLDEEILKHLESKVFVLFFKTDAKFNQPDTWKNNLKLFIQEVKKGGCQYFAVDCDIHPELWPESGKICVQLLQNGKVLSEDCVSEQECMDSIPFAKTTIMRMEQIITKPQKRRRLFLRCTGISCNPTREYEWICPRCCTAIEYGFDSNFYCECGRAPASTYEFRCTDIKHGSAFEKFGDANFLQQLLDLLKPLREMNILILGETGVGKSTWINGFYNYLTFDSLDVAQKNKLHCLIPGEFTVFDKDYNDITVSTGTDQNELQGAGQSATQACKVYSFPIKDGTLRLIDTPGIGDTRGVRQDEKNFENILKTISNLEELHGICILLKPNNARLNVMFRFCIKELLTNLHRDACRNIMFCFTNSRSTLYQPGDTLKALKVLLSENKDIQLSITSETIYCFDSESYRFLVALNKVEFSEADRGNFEQSWKKSKYEINRMLKHIDQLIPHKIQSTLSLNHARELVCKLTLPLAEINKAILTTKKMLEDEKREIQTNANYIKDLEKKTTYKKKKIHIVPLSNPKTVCIHDSCNMKSFNPREAMEIKYQTSCYDISSWWYYWKRFVFAKPDCPACSHSYYFHIPINYDWLEVCKEVEDETMKHILKEKISYNEKKEALIAAKDQLIEEYNYEQQTIEEASVNFAYFLKQNAIAPYNDAMLDYMEFMVEKERRTGGSRDTLKQLETLKASYEQKIKFLESKMNEEQAQTGLSPEDIDKTVKDLYELKHYGKDIKKTLDSVTYTLRHNAAYKEVIAQYHNPQTKTTEEGLAQKLKNVLSQITLPDVGLSFPYNLSLIP